MDIKISEPPGDSSPNLPCLGEDQQPQNVNLDKESENSHSPRKPWGEGFSLTEEDQWEVGSKITLKESREEVGV